MSSVLCALMAVVTGVSAPPAPARAGPSGEQVVQKALLHGIESSDRAEVSRLAIPLAKGGTPGPLVPEWSLKAASPADTAVPRRVPSAGSHTYRLAVVLVSYPGSPVGRDTGTYVSRLLTDHVGPFWERQTSNAVTLDVVRVGSIAINSDPCQGPDVGWGRLADPDLAQQARTQLGQGFLEAHVVIYAWDSRSSRCGAWEGLAVGLDSPTGAAAVWMNGIPREFEHDSGVLAHELGHIFGLAHSSALTCTSARQRVSAADWSKCWQVEYGNLVDVMGGSFRLGSVSAGLLTSRGWGALLEPYSADTGTRHELTLHPLAGRQGPRAAVLESEDATYVIEYRAAIGDDRDLSREETTGGPGVYVTVKPDTASLATGRDARGAAWSSSDVFVLDGDLTTQDVIPGPYSKHLPVFRPLRLQDGTHITVTSTRSVATVVITPVGMLPPSPPRPAAPAGLRAAVRGQVVDLEWHGDGSGTEFELQLRHPSGAWRGLSYVPSKPGQVHVATSVSRVHPRAQLRVRAVTSTGVSPYSRFPVRKPQ